jgi:hypothetical protein
MKLRYDGVDSGFKVARPDHFDLPASGFQACDILPVSLNVSVIFVFQNSALVCGRLPRLQVRLLQERQ